MKCDQCKQEYEPYHNSQRFCSSKCRDAYWNNYKKVQRELGKKVMETVKELG